MYNQDGNYLAANFCGYNNTSYNLYQNSSNYLGPVNVVFKDTLSPQSGFVKMNRNLYRASPYAYSFPNTGMQTEGVTFYEIKDNKMEFMTGTNFQAGVSERPITRFLLADKQSLDSARINTLNQLFNPS
jgi:hypothetical protein